MKIYYTVIIAVLIGIFLGCGKITDMLKGKETEKPASEKNDIDKREKELELRERELALEKEKINLEREKNSQQNEEKEESVKGDVNLTDFATMWFGKIKGSTDWEVSITEFDGKNFSGQNTVYWKSTPEGFSTYFTGMVDKATREVIMYEDRNAKGSGKFTGTINKSGNRMSGTWTRYSDGGSFSWNLEKMEKGDAGF